MWSSRGHGGLHAVLTGKLMEPCIPSHILSKHGCGRISELPLTTWKCITVPGHKQNKGEGPLFKTYLLLASQTSAILEKRWWLSVLVIVVPSSLEFLNIRIRISRLSKYECSEDITSNIACMWEGGGDTHTHTQVTSFSFRMRKSRIKTLLKQWSSQDGHEQDFMTWLRYITISLEWTVIYGVENLA